MSPPLCIEGAGYRIPSDEAIREAQEAYDRGEVTLLEATLLADVLDGTPASGQERES